jgi:murein DD-endopeptidase MepM/ murein hydrolase activator NlpD
VRRIVFAAIAISLAFVAAPVPAHADAWTRPVNGRVVRPFDPPKTRYGPGHLGVDFAVARGEAVRAAGAGTVVFAGTVAHTLHVVIRHANGWRTSYSFLTAIRVRAGETVAAGDIVGLAGGRGEEHDGTVVHFGLRIGDEYVDPMQLFGAPDLTTLVHLAPVGAPPSPTNERAALVQGLPPDDDPLLISGQIGPASPAP